MKIAAIVILYNPTKEVLSNIESYKNSVDYVICIDNSDNDMFAPNCSEYIYTPLYENKGIAYALNVGVKKAKELGCDWVLTMDQDSSFANDIIGIYSSYIVYGKYSHVKMYVPSYIFSRSKKKLMRDQYVKFAMQSAALIDISVFDDIGYFKEELFIDVVDYEFCLRLIQCNFKILQVCMAKLNHSPAHTKILSFGRIKFAYGYDSCIRYYYQARNLLAIGLKYKEPYLFFILLYKLSKILFLFGNKSKYLKYFSRGLVDAFRNKFGKCDIV